MSTSWLWIQGYQTSDLKRDGKDSTGVRKLMLAERKENTEENGNGGK